jgi:hypothetical protein
MNITTNFTTELPGERKLILRVAGVVVPFTGITITYALNTIPQAIITLAVGLDIKTLQRSPAAELAARASQMLPVTIHVEGDLGEAGVVHGSDTKRLWPLAPDYAPNGDNRDLAVLFTGYAASGGFRQGNSYISLQLTAIGKLVDFTMSSVGSADAVPGTPVDFFTPVFSQSSGASNLAHYLDYVSQFSADTKSDTAGAVLDLIRKISVNPQLYNAQQVVTTPLKNNLRALELIEPPDTEQFWVGMGSYADPADYLAGWVKPYPLQLSDRSTTKLAAYVGKRVSSSELGGTFWNLLTGVLLPELGMGVVPLARTAVIAPLMPLNPRASVVLTVNEWVDIHRTLLSQRPLYGVAVYGTSSTGTNLGGDTNNQLGSSYVPQVGATEGAWLFSPVPPWLDDVGQALRPESADATLRAMVDVIDTPDGGGLALDREFRPNAEEQQETVENAALYAKMLYAANSLRGREASLTTNLRFDIPPGCTIQYGVPQDAAEEAAQFFAFVTRVAIVIDAESSKSMTTLSLANVRTEAENATEGFSLQEHPFFRDAYFEYAPIVPELHPERRDG